MLVRHGESVATVRQVIGGPRTCAGLSPLGRSQSAALREHLERVPLEIDSVVASHFSRAVETAEIVAPGAVGNGGFESIEAWGEHDPGPDLDGMSFAGYIERFGTPDWADPDAEIFPGGETIRQFHERVAGALDDVLARFDGRSVMIVCHGGVIDAVFRSVLDLPVAGGGFELHTLNTSLTEFERLADGRWKLGRYNEASHLVGLPAASPRAVET